ncbi:MAG: phosphoribosylformylglycinamidine synthase subunit PurL [bacterium]
MIDYKKLGFTDEEYDRIVEILGREPNITELGMFSVLWSEHCSYCSSKPYLKLFPTSGPHILQGPGENAGVIDIGDGLAVVMKVESHNHPSAIEPYEGAATGVGGILRDIFTMGARPIALLDSLRFGPLKPGPGTDEARAARNRYLVGGVVKGIGDYGNCTGVPTVGGEIYFEECYNENPLVNVMCVGLMEEGRIVKARASGVGNPVIYVGSTTGRDGMGGAAFASKELHEGSMEDRPAVQKGDPFSEKLLIEACLELAEKDYLVGMQDMGAAGLTCSSSEMASKAGTGMEIDLDLVPKREEGMTPYEYMLSESQERMLVVVEKGFEEDAMGIFRKWGLNAAVIGCVTGDGVLRVKEDGEIAAEVPARALADDAPVYYRKYAKPDYIDEVQSWNHENLPEPGDYNDVLRQLLSSPTIASKRWVYQQYDHMVGIDTVIPPGRADAALLRIKGTKKALAMTIDGNGRYCYLNPYEGGKIAVAEAARNIVCVGAKPLAVTDCLNFGNPQKPGPFWQFVEAVRGMAEACRALGTPVVGGNVSFYNETLGKAIYPTPTVGMIGLMEDIGRRVTQGFKSEGDVIALLGESAEEVGGSEYLKLHHGLVAGNPPTLNLDAERRLQDACLEAIGRGLIHSAHDCSEGGLAVALAESCICGGVGAKIDLEEHIRADALLFGESQSRIVLSLKERNWGDLRKIAEGRGVPLRIIGRVGGRRLVINDRIEISTSEMEVLWEGGLIHYVQ